MSRQVLSTKKYKCTDYELLIALLIVIVLISKPNMGIVELEQGRETSKVPRLTLGCEEDTVHWIQNNFVFGQNSKSLLLFRNGHIRSFGLFYAAFDE